MNLDIENPISDALKFGESLITRLIPDKAGQEAAHEKLALMAESGELAQLKAQTSLQLAQVQVDQAEAQSGDRLQHWRGALGWVCAFAYGYTMIVQPFMLAIAAGFGHPITHLPALDTGALERLTFGMLGLLGGMHVTEHASRLLSLGRNK